MGNCECDVLFLCCFFFHCFYLSEIYKEEDAEDSFLCSVGVPFIITIIICIHMLHMLIMSVTMSVITDVVFL